MYKKYMEIALDLAKKGIGKVNPNPLVGAVIVKDNNIIGTGYHEYFGGNHAEVNAINSCREELKGSTMFITLEPCSHYGKTPPCTEKIIEYGICKVVVGMLDPNPLVSGRGVEKLRKSGIEVVIGVLEEECIKVNEVFIKYISEKTPFVLLKAAMSLDGKIATTSCESKWITCEESRRSVHQLRNQLSAVMVGINTIITDDPDLTCRLPKGRNPIRIIIDSNLRIPLDSKVIKTSKETKTIIIGTENSMEDKAKGLRELGAEVIIIREKNGRVDLQSMMSKLGNLGIDSILLEGGGELNFSALKANLVDKISIYIAPKLIGGKNAKTPIEGLGVKSLKDAISIRNIESKIIGDDILIEGYVNKEVI